MLEWTYMYNGRDPWGMVFYVTAIVKIPGQFLITINCALCYLCNFIDSSGYMYLFLGDQYTNTPV